MLGREERSDPRPGGRLATGKAVTQGLRRDERVHPGNDKTECHNILTWVGLPVSRTVATTCNGGQNAPMREETVRAAVAERVAALGAAHGDTLILHELSLCQAEARVDLAAVNGRLVGYEIKTAVDTLVRLPRQQEVYSRVLDRVWLVADGRHIDRAMVLIPDWWGVMRIADRRGVCHLQVVRRSKLNPNVDPYSLVRLLWRDEVLGELEALGLSAKLTRAPRRVLWDELAGAVPSRLSLPQLQSNVRARLKSRGDWRADRPRM